MSALAMLLLTVSSSALIADIRYQRDGELARCASIRDDAARLACFDAFTARTSSKDAAHAGAAPTPAADASNAAKEHPVDVTSTAVDAEAESALSRTANADSAAGEQQEADVQIARIESFARLKRSNRIRITLDNGQVWQENDGAPFRGNVEPGTEVTITKGRFGGYRMTVPTRSAAIIVRRIK